jgi:hypothetical protein
MVCSRQDVAAAFKGFGTLRYVTDSYIRHMQNAAFFLNGSAVAQDAEGITFKPDKIKESKRFIEPDRIRVHIDIEMTDFVAGTRVKATDHRHPVLSAYCGKCPDKFAQPVFEVYILCAMERDKNIFLLLDVQTSQDI